MRRNRPPLLALALVVVVALPLAHSAVAVTAAPDLSGPHRPASHTAFETESELSPNRSLERRSPLGPPLSMPVRNLSGTVNYLAIADGDVSRSTYGNASLDIAGALSGAATELRHSFESIGWRRAFERAKTDEQRVSLIRNETQRIAAEIDSLRQRQARLIDAFNAGELSARQFFRELAALDTAARELKARLERIESTASGTIGFQLPLALQTKITNLEAELVPLRGNVRNRLAGALTGTYGTVTAYTVTSDDGVVLATTTDRRFLREAYLGDRRRPGDPDQFADGDLPRISVAYQRAAELYPWLYEIPSPPSVKAYGNTSLYNVSDSHPHGRIHAYLDGATRDTYREVQWKHLERLPVQRMTGVNGSLRVVLNRTHATGPMQLRVRNTVANESVDAKIVINNETVGWTGDDGTLWTIAPHGDVRLEVRAPSGSVVLEFQARP